MNLLRPAILGNGLSRQVDQPQGVRPAAMSRHRDGSRRVRSCRTGPTARDGPPCWRCGRSGPRRCVAKSPEDGMRVAVRLDSTGIKRRCIMVLSATIPAARVRVVLERLHEPKGGSGMRRLLLLAPALVLLLVPTVAGSDVGVGPGGGTPGTSSNFELVGHNDLSGFELDGNLAPRGMNAAPASPRVVGEFGTEFVTGANLGQTSRELRVWPEQGLLMVMYFRCSSVIHSCAPSAQHFNIRFFDLFADPVDPPL